MGQEKRCMQCNTPNDAGRMYCIHCGAFLDAAGRPAPPRMTIWGNADGTGVSPLMRMAGHPGTSGGKVVAVCPMCGMETPAEDGKLPPFCTSCNYFFQAGIDKVTVPSQTGRKRQTGQDDSENLRKFPEPAAARERTGPLKSVSPDTGKLRLLSISGSGRLPFCLKEDGNLLGCGGTMLSDIHTDQQVSIWHSPSGWYFMALQGILVYNGGPVNCGIQKKMQDGDMFRIGNEYLRVEII